MSTLSIMIISFCFLLNTLYAENSGTWLNYTCSDYVYKIAHDNDGNLWCATSGGVTKLDPETGEKTVYTRADGLSFNLVTSLAVDSAGNKWIATNTEGVNLLRADGTWESYNKKNSDIAEDFVFSVAIDMDGAVWFGTALGVSVLKKD